MRVIHTADLHLDSRLSLNLDSTRAKERRKELLLSFANLCRYARDNRVDVVIIAGDMFDKDRVSLKALDYVATIMNEYKEIDFLYAPGNHDGSLDFKDLKPDNLHIFKSSYNTISYKECNITGIAYNDNNKNDIYDSLVLDKNKINIVTMHGPVSDSPKDGICISMLKDKGIDYLALGHIHSYKTGRIDSRGGYAYSGCLEGRGFDEAGPKGFILLDIDKEIKSRFIKFNYRELFNIDVDVKGFKTSLDLREGIYKGISGIDKKNMIRINLVGEFPLTLIKNLEPLEAELNGLYYLVRIVDNTHPYINPMEYEHDKSLKGEFIRMVLASDNSQEDKERIIECGIKALIEGEL